jgi:hypothetical protein
MHSVVEQRELEGIMTLEAKEGNNPLCLNVFTRIPHLDIAKTRSMEI